jgi:ABC-type ATPase involved in cell division
VLAGLEYPEGGRVRIGENDVTDLPPRKREIAMVFQSYAVFPHLKVFDNIAFGLRMRGVERQRIPERTERATLPAVGPHPTTPPSPVEHREAAEPIRIPNPAGTAEPGQDATQQRLVKYRD